MATASAAYAVSTKFIGEDAVTEVASKVSRAVKNLLSPIREVNEAIDKPKTTALGRVGAKVDEVAGKFREGLKRISDWLPALGAIGSAVSLAGLIELTRSASEAYSGIGRAAEKLGFTVPQLAQFRYAVKSADVDVATFEKGVGQLNARMYDAATGKNKDLAALFRAMGISLVDTKGKVKDASQVLLDISESFRRTGGEATRSKMAMALFGKAGEDLLPFLTRGREETTKLMAEQKKFSSLSKDQAVSLGTLNDSYTQLEAAGGGLKTRIGASLAPAMKSIVDRTTDWIEANRELIGQSIDRKVEHLKDGYNFLSDAIEKVLKQPIVEEWLKGKDAGDAFDLALGGLGLTMAGPVLSGVSAVTAAVIRMNAAMLANPWVLLVSGIVAASVAVYENWGPIKTWWQSQLDAIATANNADGIWAGLWEGFKRLNPFNLINEAANGLVKWLFDFDLNEVGERWAKSLWNGFVNSIPTMHDILSLRTGGGGAAPNPNANAGFAQAIAGGGGDMGLLPPLPPSAPADPLASMVNHYARQDAKVNVTVDFKNLPRGATTAVESSGTNRTDIGKSMADNPSDH